MKASRMVLVVMAMAVLITGCNPFAEDPDHGIAVVGSDGEFRWLEGSSGSCGYGPPKWSGDGEFAVALKGCAESVNVLGLDRDGGVLWEIADPGDPMANPWYAISPDGERMALLAYQHEMSRMQADLYVFAPGEQIGDPVASTSWSMASQGATWASWAYQDVTWTGDGKSIVILTTRRPASNDLVVFDSGGDWEPRFIPTDLNEHGPLSTSGSSVLTVGTSDDSISRIGIVDVSTGEIREFAEEFAQPLQATLSPDGAHVVVTAGDRLAILNTADGSVEFETVEYSGASGASWSVDDRIVIAYRASLVELTPDGTVVGTIYDRGEGDLRTPQWSPDGMEILVEVRPPYRD